MITSIWKFIIILLLIFQWFIVYHFWNLMDAIYQGSDLLDTRWAKESLIWLCAIGSIVTIFLLIGLYKDRKLYKEFKRKV